MRNANSFPQERYSVDYKNDCFKDDPWSFRPVNDRVKEIKSDISGYILWLEHEYHHGKASAFEKYSRDSWYSRRFSWLQRLINVLQVSVVEITDTMRSIWTIYNKTSYGAINVEESIKQFLSSCKSREDR